MSRGQEPRARVHGKQRRADPARGSGRDTSKLAVGADPISAQHALPVLHVRTLGGFSLLRGEESLITEAWRGDRLWPLFTGLLSASNHRLSRDQAIELLWPDKELADPANSLREVLSKLRRLLAGGSSAPTQAYVRSDGAFLVLVSGAVLIDADMFLAEAQRASATRDLTACQTAIDLYAGEYLPQGTVEPLSRHAALVRGRRSALRHAASDVLALAAELCDGTDLRRAAAYLQRAFGLNPSAEEKARRLMTTYARIGELAAAQEVFGTLTRTLAHQGVPPSLETTRLRDSLLEKSAPRGTLPQEGQAPAGLLTCLVVLGDGATPAPVEAVVAAHHGSSADADPTDRCWRFSFSDPHEALAAALTLTSPPPSAAIPRGMRAAVHTGQTGYRPEHDAGFALAKMLAEIAHAGQALVSHVTYAVAGASLPAHMALPRLDSYELPYSSEPVAVYQLSKANSVVTYPPLRARRHRPHNLPAPITAYVARPRLQARLGALIAPAAGRSTRLLTLTGVGGGGKTRLAVELARDLLPRFPDGVWLVELASLSEPRDVPAQIARVLGLREERGVPIMDSVAAYLRAREQPLLLVLDNCEHLVDACAQATAVLLQAGELVHVLATSRERLRMQGERAEEVPLLSTPIPRDGGFPLADIGGAESVRLFCTRSTESVPDFALSAANAQATARICARLDGIPLAIELAAAQLVRLPLTEIVDGLDRSIGLLAGGNTGALPRHQTLHAAIDWSYRLLSADAQTLFRRLAVFAGGWTAPAAQEVCGLRGLHPDDVGPLLQELLLASLAIRYKAGDQHRYRMLEPVRQYALGQLHGQLDTA